jgi:hypothetical protein
MSCSQSILSLLAVQSFRRVAERSMLMGLLGFLLACIARFLKLKNCCC